MVMIKWQGYVLPVNGTDTVIRIYYPVKGPDTVFMVTLPVNGSDTEVRIRITCG